MSSEPPPPASAVRLAVRAALRALAHGAGLRVQRAASVTAARLAPLAPPPWTPAGGPVVVVAPHPDDEVAGCGGALLRHVAAGDAVSVVIVTAGDASRALGLGAVAMRARRAAEALAAAAALGLPPPTLLDLPEAEVDVVALSARLRPLLASARRVYSPAGWDFHPVHRRVALAVAEALPVAVEVYAYPVQVPLAAADVDRLCSLAGVGDALERAFAAHGSQAESLRAPRRMRGYAGLRFGIGADAETFAAFDSVGYGAHLRATAGGRFVSLRPGALGDLVGYLATARRS